MKLEVLVMLGERYCPRGGRPLIPHSVILSIDLLRPAKRGKKTFFAFEPWLPCRGAVGESSYVLKVG